MNKGLIIDRVNELSVDVKQSLVNLLISTVNDGASIGFLSPLSEDKAIQYWDSVIDEDTILLIARYKDSICGTVQLQLSTKENGLHRAEIAKLMVDPQVRRLGIGRALLIEAERIALQNQRTLLVLDTREGDVSNKLYLSENFIVAGTIPNFALSSNGKLDGTVLYYKLLN